MKKTIFIVSLIAFFLGFICNCGNNAREPEAQKPKEKVYNVSFEDDRVVVTDSSIIAEVTVCSSKGEEVLRKEIMKKKVITDGGNYYAGKGMPEMTSQTTITECNMQVADGDWTYYLQKDEIRASFRLDDISYSNSCTVILPCSITVKKYGESFTFEDIALKTQVQDGIWAGEENKYLHRVYFDLSCGNHHEFVVCENKIEKR